MNSREKSEILDLWNNEYPNSLVMAPISQFEEYLAKTVDHHHVLLKDKSGFTKGWYFDFIQDEKRWFATILHSDLQGMGYGTQLLEFAKQKRESSTVGL